MSAEIHTFLKFHSEGGTVERFLLENVFFRNSCPVAGYLQNWDAMPGCSLCVQTQTKEELGQQWQFPQRSPLHTAEII